MLRRDERGMILIAVVMLMSVLALLGTVSMLSIRTDLLLSSNYKLSQEVLYVAQSGAEYGLNRLRAALNVSGGGTGTVVPPTISGYTFENTGSFLALSGGVVQKTLTGQFAGLTAYCQRYVITSSVVKDNTNARATVVYVVEDQSIPLFQFGVLFDHDMEILPGDSMTFNAAGPIHSNGDMYLNATMDIDSRITAFGNIIRNRKDSSPGATGTIRIKDAGGAYQTMTIESSTPTWRGDAEATWNGRVRTGDHDIQPLRMPLPAGRNPIDLLAKPGGSGYSPSLSLYAKSGLRVIKNSAYGDTSRFHYIDKSGNTIDLTAGGLYPDPDFMSTTANVLYDWRQGVLMDVVSIEIPKLKNSPVAMAKLNDPPAGGQAGLLYVSTVDGQYTDPAVRLTKGGRLPRVADGHPFSGLSVVSDRPVYIEGHFNKDNPQPAGIFADAITVLSENWSDANSGGALSSRTASNTAVYASILAGNKDTAGSNYSGGAENFIRLLENWSGKTLTYSGSLACLWEGVQRPWGQASTANWPGTGTVYNPPTQSWAFGVSFANLPLMGIPNVRGVQRISWRQAFN